MATCPSCQSQIEIGTEFFGGLFTCPSCRAVYFIGFDGVPENAQSHAPATSEYPPEQVPQIPIDIPEFPLENYSVPMEVPSFQPTDTIPDQSAPIETQNSQTSQFNNLIEQSVPYDDPTDESISPAGNFNPLNEVIEFANNEQASSLISYNVEMKGLEIQQNLQALKDVLTDSKLQINFDSIKTRINDGHLKLEKLNPAQAAVIVFRLRPLSIEMKWEQSLI